MAEVNRRVTGDPEVTPQAYFARTYRPEPRGRVCSLGCGAGQLEMDLARLGACTEMVGSLSH